MGGMSPAGLGTIGGVAGVAGLGSVIGGATSSGGLTSLTGFALGGLGVAGISAGAYAGYQAYQNSKTSTGSSEDRIARSGLPAPGYRNDGSATGASTHTTGTQTPGTNTPGTKTSGTQAAGTSTDDEANEANEAIIKAGDLQRERELQAGKAGTAVSVHSPDTTDAKGASIAAEGSASAGQGKKLVHAEIEPNPDGTVKLHLYPKHEAHVHEQPKADEEFHDAVEQQPSQLQSFSGNGSLKADEEFHDAVEQQPSRLQSFFGNGSLSERFRTIIK